MHEAQSTIHETSGQDQGFNKKKVCGCPYGRIIRKKKVTYIILSSCRLHLSMHNCIYWVTPECRLGNATISTTKQQIPNPTTTTHNSSAHWMTDLGQVRHDNFPHLAEVVTLIRFQDVSQTCQCCPFVGRLVLTTFPHSRLQYLSKTVNPYDFPSQPSPVSVAHTVNPYDSLTAVTSICHTHSQPL